MIPDGGFIMIEIRPETENDHSAVREVNMLAFGREDEAQIVETLRQSDDFIPELSLVAIYHGRVVGHILFSPILIETKKGDVSAMALATLAVRPEFQNQGIGSELVRQGLKECRLLGHRIVVVIGHPDYYPRFGFSPARVMGLEAPFQVPDEAFLVHELVPGALYEIGGMVRYPPAFDEAT